MNLRSLPIAALAALILAPAAIAQGPPPGFGPRPPEPPEGLVDRLFAFDRDGDGRLTKAELGDDRLARLFDRADADKDGAVTMAELTALASKQQEADRQNPGGPGFGPGGPMGRPRPGEVLPSPVQEMLGLDDDQKAKVQALQKEVDARLNAILTAEQRDQLRQMGQRGPGFGGRGFGGPGGGPGFGPPGGGPGGPPPGGPGGPGGPPPGGPGGRPPGPSRS